jgi:hypothetical protein
MKTLGYFRVTWCKKLCTKFNSPPPTFPRTGKIMWPMSPENNLTTTKIRKCDQRSVDQALQEWFKMHSNTGFPHKWPTLTFRARASYPSGRHLNISELAQARAYYMLGQPQPRWFKRFALNIFTGISLILSTTLEVFPASCSDWFPL